MDQRFVKKAGAYVITNKVVPFMIGPTTDGTALAIVRLGGHREGDKTAWECAKREVLEESRMRITPLTPPVTYYCPKKMTDPEIHLEPLSPDKIAAEVPRPLIIGHHDTVESVTAMYVATSRDEPVPSMETKALLLLSRKDVFRLCGDTMSLHEFELTGGCVVLSHHKLNHDLPLKPFGQLIMLAMMLERDPDTIPTDLFP